MQFFNYFYSSSLVADCGTLESGNNSRVIVSNTTFGSVAKYYCIPGYFMLGNGTRYCREDGTWSPLRYFCQRKYMYMYIV